METFLIVLATALYFLLGMGFGMVCLRTKIDTEREIPYLAICWPIMLLVACFWSKSIKGE